MDKLLPNWQYEDVPRRIWAMASPQGESGNTQAVEETEAHISEPSETEPNHRMWIHPRRNLQSCKQQTGMVQTKWNVRSELRTKSPNTWA